MGLKEESKPPDMFLQAWWDERDSQKKGMGTPVSTVRWEREMVLVHEKDRG